MGAIVVRAGVQSPHPMLVAFTREVPPSIDRCELTHLQREPIDRARAIVEHAAYEDVLRQAGCRVERLPPLPDHPDSVFVEDTAIVFDRIAVIARPGAASRRGERASTAKALAVYRPLAWIRPPGTLDGGDVIETPGVVFVGVSGRTNAEGVRQLAAILTPFGVRVVPLPVRECLHLKSAAVWLRAAAALPTILLNPAWIDAAHFEGFDVLEVDPGEPHAANVLAIGGCVICAASFPATRRRLEAQGAATITVPAVELAKAEGGVTCCSVLVEVGAGTFGTTRYSPEQDPKS
jgi:dimethylargininase